MKVILRSRPNEVKLLRKVEDGRLSVRMRTGDLGKQEYTVVRIDCHPQPRVPLGRPVKFEWRFRADGSGLQYIVTRASADGPNAHHLRYLGHKARMLLGTGWIVGAADVIYLDNNVAPDGTELADLAHCTVSIRVSPNSDLTFTIDYLKLMERE